MHFLLGLSNYKLANILREHSTLLTDFYVDTYKPFKIETLNSISRFYLALQIEENKARKLNKKYNRYDDEDDDLSSKEIQMFSSVMAEFHSVAYEHYMKTLYNKNQKHFTKTNSNKTFMAKPFSVSMFKQVSLCFRIYMRRIKEQETIKIEKFERVFRKINQVSQKIKGYDNEIEEINKKLVNLDKLLTAWDEKIEKQKELFQVATNECRKEEKLVDEMSVALEKLKADVNKDATDINNSGKQYEMALLAVQSINEQCFNELKSYRAPPQRVLAVVNTLCLMFRQPPGWDSGKLLLMRSGFYEDLIFYDKKNIPNDIFYALEQICSVDTFTPEHVKPGSQAAACFCQWIIAIYNFAKFEKTIGFKTKELRDFEEIYNERLVALGEKRKNSEKICQVLESHCSSRINVLKDIKKTSLEIEKLKEMETKANHLLKLFDEDNKSWSAQYNKALVLFKTHKMDSLVTAFYVCYLGVFDWENRKEIMGKWLGCLEKLRERSSRQSSIKFGDSNETLSSHSNSTSQISKFSLRENFNIKDIIINTYEFKDLIIQLNKLGLKDEHFLTNALILREHCSLPSTIAWPLIYDPENVTIKVLTLLQESIDTLKNNLNIEFIASSPTHSGAPIKMNHPSVFASVGYNNG